MAWTDANWGVGDRTSPDPNAYYEFDVNTSNFSLITMTYDLSRTSDGPRDITVISYTGSITGQIAFDSPSQLLWESWKHTNLPSNTALSVRLFANNKLSAAGALAIDNVTFRGRTNACIVAPALNPGPAAATASDVASSPIDVVVTAVKSFFASLFA